MTGTQAIDIALGILATLHPGSTATASQSTRYLMILNQVLSSYEAAGLNGFSLSGRTLTVTAVASYGTNPATDNTYPSGWDPGICHRLAWDIAGSEGKSAMFPTLLGTTEYYESKMLTLRNGL